jgi:hypothetical protein
LSIGICCTFWKHFRVYGLPYPPHHPKPNAAPVCSPPACTQRARCTNSANPKILPILIQTTSTFRAAYGKHILKDLSAKLTATFGKGFSVDNLQNMRSFYKKYSIYENDSRKFSLSWSHYLFLMRIEDNSIRQFYEIEAGTNYWTLHELKRQFNSALYERLALSRDKEAVKVLSSKGQVVETPQDVIKDPYILEFLGLEDRNTYSEKELETRIYRCMSIIMIDM